MAFCPADSRPRPGRGFGRLRRTPRHRGVLLLKVPSPAPVLLILAGPSGSGKSTLCDRLVRADLGFSRVVTTTTRAPREGEVAGIHYIFFTPAEFEARIAAGEFFEWAWVHGQKRYGTLSASVLEPLALGRDLVM